MAAAGWLKVRVRMQNECIDEQKLFTVVQVDVSLSGTHADVWVLGSDCEVPNG